MLEMLRDKDFDKLYQLMEESFPEDEYRFYAEQKQLLSHPLYSIYTVYGKQRNMKAFIAVWEFEEFVYVEHFAVNPSCRNKGLGESVLRELTKSTNKMICLEVELPGNEMSCRRIRFYERNKFHLNEYPYMQPPMSAGKKAIPLRIMTSDKGIDEEMFQIIKGTLYKNVYQCQEEAF